MKARLTHWLYDLLDRPIAANSDLVMANRHRDKLDFRRYMGLKAPWWL